MPGWSPEIANEFIRLAAAEARAFDQMQLQKLVYIAHGWCLAFSEQPLTGDRPEAWSFGPVYRRLSDALASYGRLPVQREISLGEIYSDWPVQTAHLAATADLNSFETDVIIMVYQHYGRLDRTQLSALTQRPGTPWAQVLADGGGKNQDIPHQLIRAQFDSLARESEEPEETS